MYFSLRISGFTPSSFDVNQQQILCTLIKQSWQATAVGNADVNCAIPSVIAYDGSSVVATGYIYYSWRLAPATTLLLNAQVARDNSVRTLTANPAALVGSAFPNTIANCACDGAARVTTPSRTQFSYNKDVLVLSSLPPNVTEANPLKCSARLSYNNVNPHVVENQVGIDDGSVIFLYRGKFCSSMAVNGGVVGIPGAGACRQYGVLAPSPSLPTQAVVNPNMGVTVTNGAVTEINFTGGYPGSGYIFSPMVTISAPNPIPANAAIVLVANVPTAIISV